MTPPRSLLVLAAAGVLLLSGTCGEGAASEGDPPAAPVPAGPARLVFGADPVLFGSKFDDEQPEVTVELRNAGGSTLNVERIESNCGCIHLGATPSKLAPGA